MVSGSQGVVGIYDCGNIPAGPYSSLSPVLSHTTGFGTRSWTTATAPGFCGGSASPKQCWLSGQECRSQSNCCTRHRCKDLRYEPPSGKVFWRQQGMAACFDLGDFGVGTAREKRRGKCFVAPSPRASSIALFGPCGVNCHTMADGR